MEFDKSTEELYRETESMSSESMKEFMRELDLSDKVKLMQYGTHLNRKNVNKIYESIWIFGLVQKGEFPQFYNLLCEDDITKSEYLKYKMEQLKIRFLEKKYV